MNNLIEKINKFIKKYNYILLIFVVLFYIFFAFYDGAIICDDSPSYIQMFDYLEPLYPLFLLLFRTFFGDNYLQVVVIVQSLLLAFATYALVRFLYEKYELNEIIETILILIFISISLLCRFAAKRGSMYSNSILTEAIAYPMFLLFFRYVTDYFIIKENKALPICIVLSLLLVSTRKQMYLSLFLLIISLIYRGIVDKKIIRNIMTMFLAASIVLFGSRSIDSIYINSIHNYSGTHSGDNRFFAAMIIYCSEEDNINNIEDKDIRELTDQIYTVCKNNGNLKIHDGSWYERVDYFKCNIDEIQLFTLWEMEREYVANVMKIDENQVDFEVDKINDAIISSMWKDALPEIIKTFLDNFLAGLMITVSADKEIFKYYAIVIYLLYMFFMIKDLKDNGLNRESLFGIFVLLAVFMNVGIISLFIFNQTRYTMYMMGLFYSALVIMALKFLRKLA